MTAVDLSHFVTRPATARAHLDLAVEGIDCAACIGDIEGGLEELPGVVAARVNYTLRRVGVDWREGALEPALVRRCARPPRLSGPSFCRAAPPSRLPTPS